MGKYIKSFEYHDDYLDFYYSSGFTYPNVSHCVNENEVHYTPLPHFVKVYDSNNNILDSLPIYNVYTQYYNQQGDLVQTYKYSCQCSQGDFYFTETMGDYYQSVSVDFYEGVNSVSAVTCTDDNDSSFTAFSFNMQDNILWINLNNEYNGGLTFTINYVNNDGINRTLRVNVNKIYVAPEEK